jgi:hypothetical protein
MRLCRLAFTLLVSGCLTTEMRPVASSPAPVVRIAERARMWEVRRAGERIGLVVLFQEDGAARDSVYVVRNPWHQDLGLIDGLGRAYRYLPHEEEPAWVGSGTVLQGAERILGVNECLLVDVSEEAAALPAKSTTPGSRTLPSVPLREPERAREKAAEQASAGGGLSQSR